jgi:hypothetical protein
VRTGAFGVTLQPRRRSSYGRIRRADQARRFSAITITGGRR